MGKYVDREPDRTPRWALIEMPYNRIKLVLLCTLDKWLARGATVIGRESAEMYGPQTFDATNWDANVQSNPKRPEIDDNGANTDDGD
jgi:hypothetical protein